MQWLYDRGGRDTLVKTLLGGATADLVERKVYDAAGRVSLLETSRGGVWYRFSAPTYNQVDELLAHSGIEPGPGGGPGFALPRTYTFTYAADGTRRLSGSQKGDGGGPLATYGWTYDVFGNRLTEHRNIQTDPSCGLAQETAAFGGDNTLRRRQGIGSCGSGRGRIAEGGATCFSGGRFGGPEVPPRARSCRLTSGCTAVVLCLYTLTGRQAWRSRLARCARISA